MDHPRAGVHFSDPSQEQLYDDHNNQFQPTYPPGAGPVPVAAGAGALYDPPYAAPHSHSVPYGDPQPIDPHYPTTQQNLYPNQDPWLSSPSQQHQQLPPNAYNTPDSHPIDDPLLQGADLGGGAPINEDVPLLPGGFGGGFVDPRLVEEAGGAPNLVRYGRIPQRQPRRYKTVKRVE
jgi:chitin synthase